MDSTVVYDLPADNPWYEVFDPFTGITHRHPQVNMRKARAREILRPLWRYCRVADRHGLTLTRSDFRSFGGGLVVDGLDVQEWIMAVCGCGEDGGTLDQHAS